MLCSFGCSACLGGSCATSVALGMSAAAASRITYSSFSSRRFIWSGAPFVSYVVTVDDGMQTLRPSPSVGLGGCLYSSDGAHTSHQRLSWVDDPQRAAYD